MEVTTAIDGFKAKIGEIVTTHDLRILGKLTDVYHEGQIVFGVIDSPAGAFEVELNGAEYCLDLFGAWRASNPNLPPAFLRCSPTA